jgi:hypothetical protein
MYPYDFMLYSINLWKMNTSDFLFDTPKLVENATTSPITLLQRLFLDKSFYDDEKNNIPEPQNNIYLIFIDSSHFKRLLPIGNYIKDFFIVIYYNKDNLTQKQIIRSLSIDGMPLPIADYKFYSLYEPYVMEQMKKEELLAKESEKNLYEDLSKEIKEIRIKKEVPKEAVKKENIPIKTKEPTKSIPTITHKDKTPAKKTIKKETIKTKKNTIEIQKEKIIKNKPKSTEITSLPKKKEYLEKKHKTKIKAKKKKTKVIDTAKSKPKKALPKIKKEIEKRIILVNKASLKYPIDETMDFIIKGTHFPKPKRFSLSSVSKNTRIFATIPNINGPDTLKFPIPKGYTINGITADSILTIIKDIKEIDKLQLYIKKLPVFKLILIDKSEISPIEWVGIEPIIKDLKKTIKKSNFFGIFYFENETLKGSFKADMTKDYEDYIWDNIYPLATSSGIRMEQLDKLAEKWQKSEYSKSYIPEIHLYLSRATLKSMNAMDDWEMTKKRFKLLKEKLGNCKFVIHSKIGKKDSIPLYKLGLPFKKIK